MEHKSYQYRHLPIPGGGYVTGFLFHPTREGLLYTRTDIGGVYRFDREKSKWISLIPHVTMDDLSETNPIAMALDPARPERLYIACGERHKPFGRLAVSEDYGDTFRLLPMPMFIHGNLNGRGTGERLILDAEKDTRLWFASQEDGLWRTDDLGKTWQHVDALDETHLTLIFQTGKALVVGSAGVKQEKNGMRGHSLYVSYDEGESFQPLEEPESHAFDGCTLNGLVAQRWAADDRYLYITLAATGPHSYVRENGYSCDSGDSVDGRIVRYALTAGGAIGPMEDITPCCKNPLDYGISGISASRNTPGMVIASTICKDDGDSVYLSRDYGSTWEEILFDLSVGKLLARAPYMRPQCNGGHSIIHWLSDIKLNPFDDDEAWFNTGTGTFRSFDLTKPSRYFTDWCDGMEETVHLNVYGMPSGNTQVLDIVGDLGGFAFTQLDQPCPNSFADENDNRYITCINADFADANPNRIVVTARGNWKGKTKGGLILSEDEGLTWRRLPMPFGLSPEIDEACRAIERPNVNAGWAALAADGQSIVWSIAENIELPATRVVVSQNGGESFTRCDIRKFDGTALTEGSFKAFADRVDSSVFYGFGSHGEMYVSQDGGRTFRQRSAPENFPQWILAKLMWPIPQRFAARPDAAASSTWHYTIMACGN